jgi:mono/diheme cytochrome c family protein
MSLKIRHAVLLATGGLLTVLLIPSAPAEETGSFEQSVRPLLDGTCAGCHNAKLASGGLNMAQLTPESLEKNPDLWRRLLRRVRAGEMPPPGIAKPPAAQLNTLVSFVQGKLDGIQRSQGPDPGRVTAHRLNRNEYTNTIRDLLAVDFRADKNFPSDDSSGGFDNMSDVLTISPVLMEKYMQAAQVIAARAIGADPFPKPFEVEYAFKDERVRRMDHSTIEATHHVEFDAEYDLRFALQGERKEGEPVLFGFWMDGKLLHSMMVDTKPSGLVYFNPYSEAKFRIYLPAGDHVFRAGFINDKFVETLDARALYDRNKNKFVDSIVFTGPFAAAVEKPSRKKLLICDVASGRPCVERILSLLARRAYRRPVTERDVTGLVHFVDIARQEGQSTEQGLQLAIQAMLVSPNFLFRVERDANPRDASAVHPVTDFELASRLSYFLWSSMPDDTLLDLAAAGRLHDVSVLDQQVKRMLADERSAAFAANFAGQWLETRNLDFVKPDPKKFPDWDPELRDAMKEETRLFFENVLRENRPISDFLSANYTFLNERLAKHYGVSGVTGPEFRRVDLTTDQRGGVLSQAGVLTVSSYPNRTSVVIRGKYVLTNILGTPPPPPPPDVPPLDESAVGVNASLRDQMQRHRADPICASCHSKMDPLGFGLENYDAIGRWRTKDGNFPVDSSGVLPNGKTFATPAEMRDVLNSQMPEFSRALIERMLTYALGRGVKGFDDPVLTKIQAGVAADGYRFQPIIREIVKSLPFTSRRGEAVSQEAR